MLVAGAANLGIAAAKVVGGLVSGSSAMLSEAAHSVADTVTEVLLLTALKRSDRPADAQHPLGHASENATCGPCWRRWPPSSAVPCSRCTTFSVYDVLGVRRSRCTTFSVYDGVRTLVDGEKLGNPLIAIAYLVLAVAFLLEGASLVRAVRQVRREARQRGVPARRYFRWTADTTVKAVVLEDSAALAGLLLAAGGLVGGRLTGSGVWDSVASLLIGVLLACVAYVLGRDNA
ncbi:cation transporter [Streptomyces sp. NPDC005202]|uniref:cation diffusion facilitator family transporter n=1 Tax=Streptomyces sp. NPDC005202 TaxID=3157021 RepID=UPI0033AFB133